MRLIKLIDGAYVNPDRINLIKIDRCINNGAYHIIILFHSKEFYQILKSFNTSDEAEEYLIELVDSCQETSEILNRLDQLEIDIRYLAGGPEYQKAMSNFQNLNDTIDHKI